MAAKVSQYAKVIVPTEDRKLSSALTRVFDMSTSTAVKGPAGGGTVWITEEEQYIFEPDEDSVYEGDAFLMDMEQAIEWFIEYNLLHKATEDIRRCAIIS